ncbi:MBOAT family O-acyltransferase [Butyrivibrio sp. AE3009]|uniref:MBOAT family O-acyltransferase n=1 Tax=Butyrivibrio sp. AE3009 TaxID=1280666 RepID=UPI0003B6211E|nr:MBOAT family O-acyltransferase [Butyrivibrio sp. AE3009]
MSLSSLTFLGIYFPILLIVYYNPFWRSNTIRKAVLFCASLGLYIICEPIYFFLLIGLILINYLLVKISDKTSKDFYRVLAILVDSGVLLFFKYINKVLSYAIIHKDISEIVFPIGLSYFSFKAISYVVDSKQNKEGTFFDAVIYISNFLTIVSGPISTYQDELPMIRVRKEASWDTVYGGIERLVSGLAKKVIIADSLSYLVRNVFSASDPSCVMAWAGAVAYTFQLFFDFSGYTDMAIGIGLLFGFKLPENFNYPYMASSISEFWKRWHMSLTKWFTRYIYIPLGGSRVKTVARHIFNLMVVWFVTAIWHGSNITFVLWALIYFVLQTIEKYTGLAKFVNKLHIGHVYTMVVVIVDWVIFRSASVGEALYFIKTMFMLRGNAFIEANDLQTISYYTIPLLLGVVLSTNIGVKIRDKLYKNNMTRGVYLFAMFGMYLLCMIITISQGYSAPLYAGF